MSAGLQVGLILKYTEVTEASEALVSTMAYHTVQNNMIRTWTYHMHANILEGCSNGNCFTAGKTDIEQKQWFSTELSFKQYK